MSPSSTTFSLEHVLHAEHARLVRLCVHLTGDHDAADDLAQETLIEAWRHRHKLVDPHGVSAWINAIARNVCLRWARSRGRELARTTPLNLQTHEERDQFEIDVELERDELATLLDRALALLPPNTRDVLIQTYIHESPHAEIAERLGLSANAVAVRVHRGKLALRRVLVNEFPDDAAAYGLIEPRCGGWQETRIWCPDCGRRRLVGHLHREQRGIFQLWCPNWCTGPGICISNTNFPILLGDVKTYKPALSKVMTWVDRYYRANDVVNRCVPCLVCGRAASVQLCLPAYALAQRDTRGLHVRCDYCSAQPAMHECLTGLVRCLGEVQQFWQQHTRIRTHPEQEVEIDGVAALVFRFGSQTTVAHLDVVVARDTFQLIQVHGSSPN